MSESHLTSRNDRMESKVSPIRRLSDSLINQIAAGEVVERPASVVKELLENALDAKATRILVEVRDAGFTSIRIVDDGIGMTAEDLPLAVERHATSKISRPEDLQAIGSFGFRGEALAAIASVSRLSVTTHSRNASNDQEGLRLTTVFGGRPTVEPTAAPFGTEVLVEDLFGNTPARRKFLRSAATEMGHIDDTVKRVAMVHPDIAFQLRHNDRLLLDVPGSQTPRARLMALLNKGQVSSDFCMVDTGDDAALQERFGTPRLSGVIRAPGADTTKREALYLFVNGRIVRDRTLQHAVVAAYREVAPSGSQPLAALHLETPLEDVDVNVHPTKAEVRFANPQGMHQFLFHAIRKALQTGRTDAGASVPSSDNSTQTTLSGWYGSGGRPSSLRSFSAPGVEDRRLQSSPEPMVSGFQHGADQTLLPSTQGAFSRLRVIGQWRDSFLVCEDPRDSERPLLLIDQHAAHERIGYERFKKSHKSEALAVQPLLLGELVDLPSLDAALLQENLEPLRTLGLDLEPFGNDSLLVRSVPALLGRENLSHLLQTIATDLRESSGSSTLEDRLDRVLMTMACHRVIRANHRLEPEEARSLLQQLDEVNFSDKCPHGRPVLLSLPYGEIERRFLRA